MEGLAETKSLLDRFEAVNARFAEDCRRRDGALIAEQGELQEKIDQADAWDLDRTLEIAMDALRCPPGDAGRATCRAVRSGAWRCAGCCCSSPDLLLLDEPTNHLDAESVAWLEQRFLDDYPGTVVAVTHDRYFLDNVAGWILELDRGRGHPVRGQLFRVARPEAVAARPGRDGRRKARQTYARTRARMGSACRPRARQAKSKARLTRLRGVGRAEPREVRRTTARSTLPPGPAARRSGHRGRALSKAFGRPAAVRRSDFRLPPGGIVGVIGPNGAGKTTLFRMITGRNSPTAALPDRRHGQARLCRPVARHARRRQEVWEEISDGHDDIDLGKRKMQRRAYVARVQLQGADQQKRSGSFRAASATASTSPRC